MRMKALHIIICMILLGLWGGSQRVMALPPETYAGESVLSSGRWVQISVDQTGPHRISARKLAEWGFRNPKSVRVHGYGGTRLSDVLSHDTYTDDLPQVQSVCGTDGSITFYAVGPVRSLLNTSGKLVHETNPYSNFGYYYLTEAADTEAATVTIGGDPADAAGCATSGKVLLLHEKDLTSPGNTGRMLVGEDFAYTRSRSYDFSTPGRIEGTPVNVTCAFVAGGPSASSISVSINGEQQPYSNYDRIAAASGTEIYGAQCVSTKECIPAGDVSKLRVEVTHNPGGTVTRANLDYLEVIYDRTLSVPPSGSIEFYSDSPALQISGQNAVVWDVTDPADVRYMELSASGAWQNRYATTGAPRRYEAFASTATLPQPTFVGTVANQNLHGLTTPDMVIVTPRAYADAANRIADFHRNDPAAPLTVEVVELDKVLHEFGSGAFDPGAIRRFMKMLYDRGGLRYALMMGKGTFDNRCITPVGKSMKSPMPLWISEGSLTEGSSYTTDDYLAFLEDNSGLRPGSDKLSVALGRIPCTSVAEANLAADKIERYRTRMPRSDWRNRILTLADDGNSGIHMTQAESLYNNVMKGDGGSSMIFSKVYIDAYEWQNGSYPIARAELYNHLNNGAMLWAYIGHGSPTALCGDNMVTYLDMSTQFFLRQWPFCYAATCSFLKWDSDFTSAAEMLYFTDDGGLIGVISAVRQVFISANGDFTAAFGNELSSRDEHGRFRPMGEVYRRSKNRLLNDENRLRFVYMGDPALHTVLPDAIVKLDSVNGQAVTPEAQVTLPARGRITLKGSVLTPTGEPFTGFSGRISATLYDAERSVVSIGHGEDGEQVPFDVHGDMLLTTGGAVTDGTFTVNVQMPSDVADNFRPATLNLYACSDTEEAIGVCRDLYVYGYDETTPDDVTPPVIHSLALNHESFSTGDRVNTTPMLLASVSDDSGINLSSAGVGHQISVTIDGHTSYSDVSSYFTPDAEPVAGAMSGTIAYTLPALSEGDHTVRLRVWDLSGNHTEQTIECRVVEGLAPTIFDVYTDANPASTSASFYVTHNRPDERLTMEVTVYNLLGQPVWSSSTSARSDMHTSAPLRWDLTDTAGRRVGRGIYLYRATVTDATGSRHSTASRKIAVTAQ